MATEDNGNITGLLKVNSSSTEDLSEYTDADESISAPTEFLAEFLSAVMQKDYFTALKYCKLILQYEPNNATAKEFYPLILEKLKQNLIINNLNAKESSGSSSNDSEDEEVEANCSTSESSDNVEENSESQEDVEEEEEEEEENDQIAGDKQSKSSSDGDATTGSYSSLEDDEAAETDQLLAALAAKYQIDNANLVNGNNVASTTGETIIDTNNGVQIDNKQNNVSNNSQPNYYFIGSSDSESPTEPCQTVAMLRNRVVPNNV